MANYNSKLSFKVKDFQIMKDQFFIELRRLEDYTIGATDIHITDDQLSAWKVLNIMEDYANEIRLIKHRDETNIRVVWGCLALSTRMGMMWKAVIKTNDPRTAYYYKQLWDRVIKSNLEGEIQ